MRVLLACLAVAAAVLAGTPFADAQGGSSPAAAPPADHATAPAPGPAFFRDALIKDAATLEAIRTSLTSRAFVVDPAIQYADLTGDGKPDAIVRVHSTGAAGVVAVFVFSTDGAPKPGDLRAQSLYRATTTVTAANQLQVDEPLFRPGDEPCCPARLTRRRYRFSARSHAFSRAARQTVAPAGARARR